MNKNDPSWRRLVLWLLLSLPMAVCAAGKIYTWTDASGVVHYGDRPPISSAADEVALQGKKTLPWVVVDEQLPGLWFGSTNDGGEVKFSLFENGSITYIQTRADQSVYNYQGIWTLEDTRLTVITEFSQTAPPGGDFKRSIQPIALTYTITGFSENALEVVIGPERFNLVRLEP